MSKPLTSLEKVTALLAEHQWQFTVIQKPIQVPDPDPNSGVLSSWGGGRRSYVPKITVEGTKVSATNGESEGHWTSAVLFSLEFDAQGRYVASNTRGSYPVSKGTTLTKVLEVIAKKAPQVVLDNKARREAEDKARDEREVAQVAQAYAEATQALTEAQAALYQVLLANGLNAAQARVVVVMSQEQGNPISALQNALHVKERIGQGWLPGSNSVSGTYVNGVRVNKEA